MSGSPGWLLQQAVFTRLNGDTALVTTLGAKVYDEVPDGAAFPYVTIGDVIEAPNDTMGTTGRDPTITVHAWSRYRGSKQVKLILSRVDELLDRWKPTIAGWDATDFQQVLMDTMRDPDGITRHGVARYRIHTHQ